MSKYREKAIEIAAQCWCDKETSMIVMDERLAMAFAKRLEEQFEQCDKLVEALEVKMGWDAEKFIKDVKARYISHDSEVTKEELYLCVLITQRILKESELEKALLKVKTI